MSFFFSFAALHIHSLSHCYPLRCWFTLTRNLRVYFLSLDQLLSTSFPHSFPAVYIQLMTIWRPLRSSYDLIPFICLPSPQYVKLHIHSGIPTCSFPHSFARADCIDRKQFVSIKVKIYTYNFRYVETSNFPDTYYSKNSEQIHSALTHYFK